MSTTVGPSLKYQHSSAFQLMHAFRWILWKTTKIFKGTTRGQDTMLWTPTHPFKRLSQHTCKTVITKKNITSQQILSGLYFLLNQSNHSPRDEKLLILNFILYKIYFTFSIFQSTLKYIMYIYNFCNFRPMSFFAHSNLPQHAYEATMEGQWSLSAPCLGIVQYCTQFF